MSIDKEIEAPEVVASLYRDAIGEIRCIPIGDPYIKNGMEVMTVAQHHRIMAANDVEIARLKTISDNYFAISVERNEHIVARDEEIALLRAQLGN